ncbi:PLP-dependent transferase [Antarctobacter sp.]|uniref:PLP-dependent transferase n=1 Tax=Antarctobacter sp. TaxID=1872577 RepID=UPI003A8E1603
MTTHAAVFCESLANPSGAIMDLDAIGEIAKQAGIPLIVDNTSPRHTWQTY